MDPRLVRVALARAGEDGSDRQLAVGGLTAQSDGPESGSDPLLSLIQALAYAAEVLQVQLDEIFDEAFVETSYDGGTGVVRIEFGADMRPVVCVLLDSDTAYVAAVGERTGTTQVRFGDGAHGERPPEGFENVAAAYRDGAGGGTLELGRLGLSGAIWLIVLSRHHRPVVRRVGCSGPTDA
jgi:hypothetical protein